MRKVREDGGVHEMMHDHNDIIMMVKAPSLPSRTPNHPHPQTQDQNKGPMIRDELGMPGCFKLPLNRGPTPTPIVL